MSCGSKSSRLGSCSDLCTKNVNRNLVEHYLKQLSVRVEEGRAEIAQQLHSFGVPTRQHDKKPPTGKLPSTGDASGEVGVVLIPVVGGRRVSAVNASPSVGVCSAGKSAAV